MPRWERTKADYLTKRRKMSDGEIISIGVERAGIEISPLDERVYASLTALRANSSKHLAATMLAAVLSILSHFDGLTAISASGIEISKSIFSHFALVSLSITSAAFCITYCKQTYIQTWFNWKFKKGNSGEKAKLLLLYPEAFFHFSFLPINIGYPNFIQSNKGLFQQFISLLLVLLALIIYAIGSIALWIALALDVINSSGIGQWISIVTVIFCFLTVLIGWTAPFYADRKFEYRHHGLVNMLTKQNPEKLRESHLKILLAASRMGFVELP